MVPKSQKNDQFYIKALNIVDLLKSVLEQANEISLQAMNAKSVVSRAGVNARAIQPITDHINDFAKNIIDLVTQISLKSLEISRDSLSEFMEERTVNYFKKTQYLGKNSQYISSLDGVVADANRRYEKLKLKNREHIQVLSAMLEDIAASLLAAISLTSKFRLEIGVSDTEYDENFNSLVQRLEGAADEIRNKIRESKRILIASARALNR